MTLHNTCCSNVISIQFNSIQFNSIGIQFEQWQIGLKLVLTQFWEIDMNGIKSWFLIVNHDTIISSLFSCNCKKMSQVVSWPCIILGAKWHNCDGVSLMCAWALNRKCNHVSDSNKVCQTAGLTFKALYWMTVHLLCSLEEDFTAIVQDLSQVYNWTLSDCNCSLI